MLTGGERAPGTRHGAAKRVLAMASISKGFIEEFTEIVSKNENPET